MHLAEPVAVVIAGELPGRMADGVVRVAPFAQPGVDVVLVGVDHRPLGDRFPDRGADGPLPDVGQHANDDLAASLDHPEDRRLLLLQRPPARCPLQPSSPTRPPFFATASWWPLCPATT